jgi:RNA polymerase sigma-70 factor (ECF subfamily)
VIDRAVSPQLPEVSAVAAANRLAPEEFSAVYRAEFPFVVNSLRRLGIHQPDLEDLTHEVFMTALRRRDSYDPQRPIRAWLFGIAFRLAADFKRLVRHSRELPLEGTTEAPDRGLSPDDAAVARQDRQLVLDALARIELSRRGVFIMHDIEGIAAPEIARTLEIPVGTAHSRLRQARIEFAQAVRALRQPEGGQG